MKRRVERIVCCLTLLLVGYSLRELYDWTYFSLDKNVSIIDALSIFLTLFGTLYIARIIEKEKEIARLDKDIFITYLNAIEVSLLTMEERVSMESKYTEITEVYTDSKKKSTKFFKRMYKHMQEVIPNIHIAPYEDNIMKELNSLKPLLTNTPNQHITLSKGIITYTPERQAEVRVILEAILDNLFDLKILINRS